MENDNSAESEDSDSTVDLTRRTFVGSVGTGVVALATGCKTVQDTSKSRDRESATPRFGYGGSPVASGANHDTTPTPPLQVSHPKANDTTSLTPTRSPPPASTGSPPETARLSTPTDEPSASRTSGESASGSTAGESSSVDGRSGDGNGGGTGGSIGGGWNDQPILATATPTAQSQPTSSPLQANTPTPIPREPSTPTPKPTESPISSTSKASTPTPTGSDGDQDWGDQGYGQYRYGG